MYSGGIQLKSYGYPAHFCTAEMHRDIGYLTQTFTIKKYKQTSKDSKSLL